MSIAAKGVAKKVAYAKETAWGVAPSGSGPSKYLRRVTADFNLEKESYESNEIRTDYQVADFRHGVRSASGSLSGELSPKSYADFMQSVVGRDFTAGVSASGLTVDIAASGQFFTITRGTGSFLTAGFKVGQIVRMTGAGLATANQNNNALVVAVSATTLTVRVLSDTPMVAETNISGVTVQVVGKYTYAPLANHTDDSYTIEQWFSDIGQSEVFTGMKVGSMSVSLPATGLVTCDFSLMGKDLARTGTAQYFTAATPSGTEGIFAAVNGALIVNGQPVGVVTSMDFNIERNMENLSVVGSNSTADIVTGRIRATGNMSVYFTDTAFRDYFDNETPVSVVIALTTAGVKNADAMSFTFPKVKLGSFTKDDGEGAITASASFTALLKEANSDGLETTTVAIQDTSL